MSVQAEILVKNHTVESVELQRNLLTAKGMEAFGKALKVNTSVKVLRLDFNSIKDAGTSESSSCYHLSSEGSDCPWTRSDQDRGWACLSQGSVSGLLVR